MSLGTGHWKLLYDTGTSTDIVTDVNSTVAKSVKYDSVQNKTIDGTRHDVRNWKYLTYTITINGFTQNDWNNIWREIDGKVVQFFEHEDNNVPVDCWVESVMPFYENNQYEKLKIKVVITTIYPTIESLITPTGSNTQVSPILDHSLGYSDWLLYLDGDDYEPGTDWNLAEYEFNKPDQVISKSVLTGRRWLTRKGTYNKHKITIKEPDSALVTALLNNVGVDVNFTPFQDNPSFNETMILKDVNYFNPEGYYVKNSVEFMLQSKGYTTITPT